ncbi:MAG: PD40 domain-containing protein [Candidatus Brocadiae bacterium]|nr:PD40 domain-containing protein [Candidatus Brocadiia bacterium]
MHRARCLITRPLLLAAIALAFGQSAPAATGPGEPLQIDKPLVAHWTFDEEGGTTACLDASGNGHNALPAANVRLARTDGVFENALRFQGRHRLHVPGKPDFSKVDTIALSAWVMPKEFEKYNEIFRKEDGNQRVLFAFQETGTILSLGLNVGGYAECDAQIKPEQVLDGAWHHCAATFDGQAMRVYLDGKEIGSLKRPGKIVAGGLAAGCIGSANGGECFQGAMDDLRIYSVPLTAAEVAQLHRNGRDALNRVYEPVPADEPTVAKPLVAHWTFNERGKMLHDTSGQPATNVQAEGAVPRTRGVHGKALRLAGTHALKANIGPRLKGVARISFSAWAKPADVRGFREIFRQDCGERLLFAFQESGSVLSFGLNVGGYEECDAPIKPTAVRDGAWHHCAATFDGQTMRVYLDGRQVGSLQRPGTLAISTVAPAFIGSSGGTGEHFQGGLDDLRIYGDALTADEVATLYKGGTQALARVAKELEKEFSAFYAPGKTFADTVASTRKNIVEKRIRLRRELADAGLSRLRAAFPKDYTNFVQWTGIDPLTYLTSRDADLNARLATRLVELLVEYKPLTEAQWKRQTPADLKQWKDSEAIQNKFLALQQQGDAARFSPEWIRIILDAGPRIQHRPRVREAVAPYITPATPETRDLTAEEARAALERDWLHQADRNPSPQRIQDEIEWTAQLAARIKGSHAGQVDITQELAALTQLEKQAAQLKKPSPELYFKVREVKRRIAFKNPVVDFDQMLLVDMPFPRGSEWPHETRHRLGYMAIPGARLLVLDGLSPSGSPRQLMPQAPFHGSFWRPDLSWDAKQVVFCFKPHNEKAFHLYEINVDGTGLRQLTDGIYDDFDPVYLPDGKHILFSTTRSHTYVRCMPPTNAFPLARCDRDGRNIYLMSRGNEPEYTPSVLNDGRVIYTRWEYTDKPLWRCQSLWTMNPDGTQVNTFWGNQSVWPDLLKDARTIPNSRRVMFTGSAHHNWFSGSVGIVDPKKGLNFPHGLTKVTADVAWPESGNGPVDPVESPRYHRSGSYPAYYSPYPLSETDFIVSANRGGKFVLYLMDTDGNRELIYEGTHNIFHAQPLRPRPRPPVIEDRVAWPTPQERHKPKPGIIYSNNVYHGAPAELRSKAKYLRILNIEHKTYTYWYERPYLSSGPVVSGVQSEGVKRVLGTVPIEKDGSVNFEAPSGIALHFQLLDERHRALQTMRSFTGVMPGERRGCLGCHEMHSVAPETDYHSLAVMRQPAKITPPPWGADSVSYARYVRPVLDKYCAKCHTGEGKGRKKVDMTPRPGRLGFDDTYWLLTGNPAWGRAYEHPKNPPPGFGIADMIMVEGYDQRDPAAYATLPPMTKLSYKSRLVALAASGKHNGVKMAPDDLLRLILWVDTMCPYRGSEEVRAIDDPEFQGVDWLSIRPRVKTAPRIVRPGPID